MSATDSLSRKQFPKVGNEALDKVSGSGLNSAAQREQEFSWSYDINHPRPKDAENVTAPGA